MGLFSKNTNINKNEDFKSLNPIKFDEETTVLYEDYYVSKRCPAKSLKEFLDCINSKNDVCFLPIEPYVENYDYPINEGEFIGNRSTFCLIKDIKSAELVEYLRDSGVMIYKIVCTPTKMLYDNNGGN